ncbi:MAG TPA: sugar phosphate isomerase/epimerase [Bacillota bacterium]|nr:sugar phosphate isomerase/epimerase [Bacillota bacterium]
MFYTGLVSVTFRKLDIAGVVDAATRAGLGGIEWGGDIHVPHGNLEAAAAAAKLCKDAGLCCYSYGSYYRAGKSTDKGAVIETALALGAPNIRIWAGTKGSADTTPTERAEIVADIAKFAEDANKHGLTVTFEWHGGTLTDDTDSALALLDELGHPQNVYLYWQPNQYRPLEYNLDALRKAAPYLLHVHVFNWDGPKKYPLRNDGGVWKKYLDVIREHGKPSQSHGLLLEFSHDDTVEAMLDDAEYLKSLL